MIPGDGIRPGVQVSWYVTCSEMPLVGLAMQENEVERFRQELALVGSLFVYQGYNDCAVRADEDRFGGGKDMKSLLEELLIPFFSFRTTTLKN